MSFDNFEFYSIPFAVLICAAIIIACVCRVGRMDKGHLFRWCVMYTFFAAFALFTMIDLYTKDQGVTGASLLALLGILLNLAITAKSWQEDVPNIVKGEK